MIWILLQLAPVTNIPISDPSAMKTFYQAHSVDWIALATTPLNYLFGLFLVIEIWRTTIDVAGKNADIHDLSWAFVNVSLHRGFWATMIVYGPGWLQGIVDGFAKLGQVLGGIEFVVMTPSKVFADGLDVAGQFFSNSHSTGSLFDPLTGAALLIAAWLVVLAFTILCAHFLKCSIETIIVMRAAFILVAFGATRWTEAYAERYITLVVACALRLMILTLIIGFGHTWKQNWWTPGAGAATASLSGPSAVYGAMQITGETFLYLVIAWFLPSIIAGILSGAPALSGKELVSALAPGIQAVLAGATIATSIAAPPAAGAAAGGLAARVASAATRALGFGAPGGGSRPQPPPPSMGGMRPQPQP